MALIEEKYIFQNVDLENKDELFKFLSEKLIKEDIVKSDYAQALSEREADFPTGLPLPIGVAIPHTDASHVNENKLVIVKPNKPINFQEMGGDEDDQVQAQLIINIVMSDGEDHLSLLQNVILSLQDQDYVKKLVEETDTNKLLELLNEHILKELD